MTRIVGIDLSLTSTGVAVVDVGNLIPGTSLHRITSKGKAGDDLATRLWRLTRIHRQVIEVAESAYMAVIESPTYSTSTGHAHDRAGLWWSVVKELDRTVPHIVEVSGPARCLYATGKGNSAKDHVLAAAIRRYPTADVTGNDVADALILAAIGARKLGHPIDNMPAHNQTALAKVRWPEGITA